MGSSKTRSREATPTPNPNRDSDDLAQRFDLLVDQVIDYAIFLLDRNGRISTWNAGAERIKGYSREDAIGQHYRIFFSDDDRKAGKPDRILEIARTEGRFEGEGWRLAKDGRRFWAGVVLTAIHNSAGELRGFAKITRDLTLRIEAEQNARRLAEVEAAKRQAEIEQRKRDEIRRRQSQLANLRSDVGAAAAQASEIPSLLDRSAHALVEHLDVSIGQIWLVDETTGTLELCAGRGEPLPSGGPKAAVASPESPLGMVRARGASMRSNDLGSAGNSLSWAIRAGMTAFAAAPMIRAGHTAGVVAVFSTTDLPDDVAEALRSVANILMHCIDRCRAEEEVRRSHEQLDLILRNISEGVSVQSPDGELVFVNDAAARMTGFDSAAEMRSTPRKDILSQFEVRREDGARLNPGDLPGRRALQGEAAQALLRFKSKRSGTERWSYVSASPVLNPQGKVEFAVSVFREFTERKRAEQAWQFLSDASAALGSSLDYEATLAQVATLAVPLIADWSGVEILKPDGSLEQLAVAHADPDKIELAKEWRRRWPPEPDSIPLRVVRTGLPQLVSEITPEMIDATTKHPEQRRLAHELGPRSAMAVPLIVGRMPLGVLTFVCTNSGRRYDAQDLIMATEIGRRAALAVENARAYTEAQAAIQARDTFLSIASHELRTPLSSLTILMTSLLRTIGQDRLKQLGPDGLKQRLLKAERQTAHLTHLVDRLLDVTVLSAGDMPLEVSQTDLTEVAREVLAGFEEVASGNCCRLELEAAGPVVGHWDHGRVNQVITNLVSNAIKYARGTPVKVSVESTATHARLVVRDRGPGIDRKDHERIFSQFARAASPNVAGMGLGLWIVRRIVDAHRGTVTLESEPGQGAEFTVVLPLDPLTR